MSARAKFHRPTRPNRRGVLLLVVLSILVLFLLISVTFVIVGGRFRDTGRHTGKMDQVAEDPQRTLDDTLQQILTGPSSANLHSVFKDHELLNDLYGRNATPGRIVGPSTPVPTPVDGQLLQMNIESFGVTGPLTPLRDLDNYYNGCVLTFTTGEAAQCSVRVTKYDYADASNIRIWTTRPTRESVAVTPGVGDLFLINGRPFSGTGFGFNPASGILDDARTLAPLAGSPWALVPNRVFAPFDPPTFVDDGSANEDYDAPDYQNMALGLILRNPLAPDDMSQATIIPSFHRPELVQYWLARAQASDSTITDWTKLDPALLRAIMLRPSPLDHRASPSSFVDFTGAIFDPTGETFEVDNDGDGRADGVWLDPGYSVRRGPDGRLYKPLVSVLCLDMDGRLNVNAHGNLNQIMGPGSMPVASSAFAGGPPGSVAIPRGQGYGTPEINLGKLLSSDANSLYLGSGSFLGRYGSDLPGLPGQWDAFSSLKLFEHPMAYYSHPAMNGVADPTLLLNRDGFGTPPDLQGRGALALDWRGSPYYVDSDANGQPDAGQAGEPIDNPYELDLSRDAAMGSSVSTPDTPFTAHELEKLLRQYDIDAQMLPDRLWSHLSNSRSQRDLLTTHSYDLPSPAFGTPAEFRTDLRSPHILDLLQYRLLNTPPGMTAAQAAVQCKILLPPELLAGQRMDINRALGDGYDNNSNRVVDEPGEGAAMYFPHSAPTTTPPNTIGVGLNLLNDDPVISDPTQVRQIVARHLYVLMMLLKHPSFVINESGNTADDEAETARYLAQWAVNAVDFRDRDSIMTAFFYDAKPFDGWDPSGADGGVVWGCERPELLITETLAFHDNRTENLDGDGDREQRLLPRGSLFVELYNPGSPFNSPSGELNGIDGGGAGINLNAKASDGSPVWRVLVMRGPGMEIDLDDPAPEDVLDPSDIERSVYFVDMNAGGIPSDLGPEGLRYSTSLGVSSLLYPDCYAVIGPGRTVGPDNEYATTVGRRKDANDTAPLTSTTRRIELRPSEAQQVRVENNDYPGEDEPYYISGGGGTQDIKNAVAVVIDQPRALSITEPVVGYRQPPATPPPPMVDGEPTFQPFTEPALDSPSERDADELTTRSGTMDLTKTAFYQNARRLRLQRLANPLLPYNAVSNPYRTVDSMWVNVTSFNGVDGAENTGAVRFASYERGTSAGTDRNLWHEEPPSNDDDPTSNSDNLEYEFGQQLLHSLGFLNRPFHEFFQRSDGLNLLEIDGGYVPDAYLGSPKDGPFAWLNWNNRPYVSQYELMFVPTSRSSQLLNNYTTSTSADPYAPDTGIAEQPFGHLLNFFQSGIESDEPGHFYRLFDYVHVPSRFVGTTEYLRADLFGNPSTLEDVEASEFLKPPFNQISRFRDPGRINLNTISDSRVLQALLNQASVPTDPTWPQFVDSRRGDGASTGDPATIDATYPSRFNNPFRSANSEHLIPLDPLLRRPLVDVTLLRRDPSNPAVPLFGHESGQPHNHTDRNPYFRYQTINRLGNLVTNRSNVYAVWITVGYFEVEANIDTAAFPDGYKLVREMGIETSEVKRHRAFYIIDRSIPVAYEPGQWHNAQNTILLKRFIE